MYRAIAHCYNTYTGRFGASWDLGLFHTHHGAKKALRLAIKRDIRATVGSGLLARLWNWVAPINKYTPEIREE